jgi:tetraacyldisaccharide 4'-kinase
VRQPAATPGDERVIAKRRVSSAPMTVAHALRALLFPVSLLYALASRFDGRRRARRAWRSALPVISVGNISVGGSGKTPLVALLAERLKKDHPVIILSRGYGRHDSRERVWRAGEPLPDPALVGDEPALLAQSISRGAIAVGPDRARLARAIEGEFPDGTIILDDGFQHRRLARDVDIVIVDDSTATPPHRLLPAGRLREPPHALGRADVVVALSPAAAALAGSFLPAERVFPGAIVPVAIRRHGSREELPAGAAVVLVTGIARPQRAVDTVAELGARLVRHLSYRDHMRYTSASIAAIARALDEEPDAVLVTTSKDAVKLERARSLADRLFVVDIALRIADEERFLRVVREQCARARGR